MVANFHPARITCSNRHKLHRFIYKSYIWFHVSWNIILHLSSWRNIPGRASLTWIVAVCGVWTGHWRLLTLVAGSCTLDVEETREFEFVVAVVENPDDAAEDKSGTGGVMMPALCIFRGQFGYGGEVMAPLIMPGYLSCKLN